MRSDDLQLRRWLSTAATRPRLPAPDRPTLISSHPLRRGGAHLAQMSRYRPRGRRPSRNRLCPAASSRNEYVPGSLYTFSLTHNVRQKLGDIDTSSGKSVLWGMHKKDPPPPAALAPSALPSSKTMPPPPRRIPSTRPRTPTPEPESEPEYEGEWAEALYDFTSSVRFRHFLVRFAPRSCFSLVLSQDPNDLPLQAEERVLVTARTSPDWYVNANVKCSGAGLTMFA